MNKSKWLRCFLVSLVVAVIAPFLTTTVGVAESIPFLVEIESRLPWFFLRGLCG